jgi:hypothetical protein
MSAQSRPITEPLRQQIENLWDFGHDTCEIGKRLGIEEHRVYRLTSLYVTTKKFRKSAF